jgi:hypothetical protein
LEVWEKTNTRMVKKQFKRIDLKVYAMTPILLN